MIQRTSGIATVFVLITLTLAACGAADADPTSTPPSGSNAPGRDSDSDDPSKPAPPPPVVGEPEEAELTEAYGVFVVAGAAVDGPGTREHPIGTISGALVRAKAESKRVYVCAGTYKESVVLEDAIPVVGGFDCSEHRWKRGAQRSRIESPTSPALRAKDIVTTTRFDSFEVVAPDTFAPSASSIAFVAESASGLEIVKSKLEARAAGDGADGVDGIQLSLGAAARGGAAEGSAPFVPGPLKAVAWRSGGEGGAGACIGAPGHDGESGGAGGSGGTYLCTEFPTQQGTSSKLEWDWYATLLGTKYTRGLGEVRSGRPGSDGASGASATTMGVFTPDGYAPANGQPGAHGAPGRGGSGAAGERSKQYQACAPKGYILYGADGAGGGAGGCPGLAGTPGTGGGASVAALVFASPDLTFDESELVAGRGGRGGRGTLGSLATAGGAPGTRPSNTDAAGAGGAGGRAGVSGSGAGGPSIALAHSGTAPKTINGTTTKVGLGGAGVEEQSKVGYTLRVPASAAGITKEVYAF